MKLVVFSHKPIWRSERSPSGYASNGGFPVQMRALAELFDEMTIVAPFTEAADRAGEMAVAAPNLSIVPLTMPAGSDWRRKLALPGWLLGNARTMIDELRRADAVHTPIPGDIGTIGMLLALAASKPLFVRHCGNWNRRSTLAEYLWPWLMERFGGGRRVMLATGGAPHPPSNKNSSIQWIFSTTMTAAEMRQIRRPPDAFPSTHPRLIIVGRQEEGKGTGIILRALPLLVDDFPRLELRIVGDGSALPKLRLETERAGLADRVTFHGSVDHRTVLELLAQSDLFCFPTRSEGFPKVVIEAMACGLPVIASGVSVLPRIVGRSGVILDRVTPEELAEAVRFCLSDPDRYRRMSEQARSQVERYTLEGWRDAIGSFLTHAWGPLRRNV